MTRDEQDEIIDAYRTIANLADGDPYFLEALNFLRIKALDPNCPECAEKMKTLSFVKSDRARKLKTIRNLRSRVASMLDDINRLESAPAPKLKPRKVEFKVIETWDGREFERALSLGHFSWGIP